jgi:dihydroorotate dehydrogenase
MYPLIRAVFFLFPPEAVHYFSMNGLRLLCSIGPIRQFIINSFRPLSAPTKFSGLSFENPIGLAAGFDKNAKYLRELDCLGFGHVEIGTVTPLAQDGNPKPRLFRLTRDKALINRMGFNNDGVKLVAERLRNWKTGSGNSSLVIGGNIGKNKITPNEEAWKDYEICFRALHPYVDYFVVNVSSPNTPGLRDLQEKESLRKILTHLQLINSSYEYQRPLLLKIAPDLNTEQLSDVVSLAMEIKLDGLVISNTTISREGLKTPQHKIQQIGAGGLSGKPVQSRSTEILRYIASQTNGRLPLIASGGVFTGADAREKIESGAGLVQVWTGFIYEGPAIVKKILKTINK